MTYRQEPRPFEQIPRIALQSVVAVLFPFYLVVGAFVGIWRAACEWRAELVRIGEWE